MPEFGDIRDSLVALPENPWGGYGGSYVESDLFPVRHRIVSEECPEADSIFEFGGYFGYCLVTLLDACPNAIWLGWSDAELYAEGSNESCLRNIAAYITEHPRGTLEIECFERSADTVELEQADIVSVDGDHSYHGCLVDLALALAMKPKLILVDDFSAIAEVRAATVDFCRYTRLPIESVETQNGLGLIRPGG